MNKLTLHAIGSALNSLAIAAPSEAGKRILQLFSTPRTGRLHAYDRTFLETAEWGQAVCQGLTVQYYCWEREGPTILLAHGWESNSARWQALIGRLRQKNYRVVALDAPAHGASGGTEFNAILYADFIKAVADVFRPDFFIGHSAGAMALSYYLLQHPSTLCKVAMLASPSELRQITGVFADVLRLSARAMQCYAEQVQRKFDHSLDYFSVAEFAKSISADCLVIHDTGDTTAPYADAQRIARNWAGARLVTTEGLGHSLQGEVVYQALLEFFDQ